MYARRTLPLLASLAGLLLLASPLNAHPGRDLRPGELWGAWTFDPWVLMGLGVPMLLYARGVGRVWGRAGQGRGIGRWQFYSFCLGMGVLVVALLSPVHALGGALFSGHMLQHQLLILLAAPLLALGAPGVALAWALPRPLLVSVAQALRREPMASAWNGLSHPLGAGALFAVALWGWHIPSAYQATLENESIHAAQHISFFLSSLLFWWVIAHARRRLAGYGFALLLVFATMLHGNALGALLTFAPTAWYPAYIETAARWGLSGLEDQQLGGMIMWIPSGLVYLSATLALIALALRHADRKSQRGAIGIPAATTGSTSLASRLPDGDPTRKSHL